MQAADLQEYRIRCSPLIDSAAPGSFPGFLARRREPVGGGRSVTHRSPL